MKKYQEIGSVSKTFGLKGQLKLKVSDEYVSVLVKEKVVYFLEGSSHIPYFIESIEQGTQTLIKLEEVDSKEAAVKLTGKELFVPNEAIADVEEKDVADDLLFGWAKGYLIIDTDQEPVGDIIDILVYPQQELAVVEYKGKEILVPMNEKLIVGIDEEEMIMMVDVPDGLLNM